MKDSGNVYGNDRLASNEMNTCGSKVNDSCEPKHLQDKEIIEIISSWVALTKKIDRCCRRFEELQQRSRVILRENKRLRKRIKELENANRQQ